MFRFVRLEATSSYQSSTTASGLIPARSGPTGTWASSLSVRPRQTTERCIRSSHRPVRERRCLCRYPRRIVRGNANRCWAFVGSYDCWPVVGPTCRGSRLLRENSFAKAASHSDSFGAGDACSNTYVPISPLGCGCCSACHQRIRVRSFGAEVSRDSIRNPGASGRAADV